MDTIKKLLADAKVVTALFDCATGIVFLLVGKFDPDRGELVKEVFILIQPLFASIVGALYVQEKAITAKIAAQIAAAQK